MICLCWLLGLFRNGCMNWRTGRFFNIFWFRCWLFFHAIVIVFIGNLRLWILGRAETTGLLFWVWLLFPIRISFSLTSKCSPFKVDHYRDCVILWKRFFLLLTFRHSGRNILLPFFNLFIFLGDWIVFMHNFDEFFESDSFCVICIQRHSDDIN